MATSQGTTPLASLEQIALEDTPLQNAPTDKAVMTRTPSFSSQKIAVGRSPTDDRGYLEEQDNRAPMVAPRTDDGLIPVHNDHSTLEVVVGPPSPSPSTAPPYSFSSQLGTSSARSFAPTAHFQVQTEGKGWFSSPMLRLHPEPIPVFVVPANSTAYTSNMSPKYLSLRNVRSSDNSVLVAGDSTDGPVLSSTLFVGMGQPPQIRSYAQHPSLAKSPYTVFRDMDAVAKDRNKYADQPTYEEETTTETSDGATSSAAAGETKTKTGGWAAKVIGGKTLTSKGGVRFATPYGEFEWRYCEKWERKFWDAESVLALEKIVPRLASSPVNSSSASISGRSSVSWMSKKDGGNAGADEERVLMGYFVRNDVFRSPGTKTHTAGNGGRLMLDLREWEQREASKTAHCGMDDKAKRLASQSSVNDVEEMEKIAVTTVVFLLHKEIERRRVHQAIIIF